MDDLVSSELKYFEHRVDFLQDVVNVDSAAVYEVCLSAICVCDDHVCNYATNLMRPWSCQRRNGEDSGDRRGNPLLIEEILKLDIIEDQVLKVDIVKDQVLK